MASGFHFALLLCLTSGLLAAVSGCEEKKKEDCCPASCPPFWTQFGSRCFHYYYHGRSWPEAQRMCLSIGGNLASVRSAEENAFLRNYEEQVSGHQRGYWIGGFNHVKEHMWMWVDGSRFDYKRWYVYEPSGPSSRDTEHCLMTINGNYWNNLNCTYTVPFMCSKDL